MASPRKFQIAYRIADARHPIFDGFGAMLTGGRWNSPGHPVIYAAASYGGAMLELLVHSGTGRIPRHQRVVVIRIPSRVVVESWSDVRLPLGWNAEDNVVSRAFGDEWIRQQRSAVLVVPSVVAKYENNIVINPAHPDTKAIGVSPPEDVVWDKRLFRR